ncbi:hypothetical protein EDD21DRAFT_389453 [Dissophora ornata]|nr:hypothetical protein EDD21DRAFT_389453 [Dissophora ornata]
MFRSMFSDYLTDYPSRQQPHHSSLGHVSHTTSSSTSHSTTAISVIAVVVVVIVVRVLALVVVAATIVVIVGLAHGRITAVYAIVVVCKVLFIEVHLITEIGGILSSCHCTERVFPLSLSCGSVDVEQVFALRVVLTYPSSGKIVGSRRWEDRWWWWGRTLVLREVTLAATT